jgi:cell division septal protein FtsQ
MKKIFSLIPGMVVVVLIVLVGAYSALGSRLKIRDVEISQDPSSHETVLYEEIKKDLAPKMKKLVGAPMLQFSFGGMLGDLLKDKRIKNISLRREFPSTLIVKVLPREPVLEWVDEKGRLRPVAKDNEILPSLRSGFLKDAAVLRGREFFENSALRKAALELMAELPQEGYFRKSLVSEIHYDKASGFDLILSDPAVTVKMGHEDYPARFARVEKVLSYIQNRGIKGRVIDSRFDKKIVVRLRNEP